MAQIEEHDKNIIPNSSKSPLDDQFLCKICLEHIEFNKDRFTPCHCKQPLHRECLNEWLKHSRNKYKCELCHYKYQYKYKIKWKGCIIS